MTSLVYRLLGIPTTVDEMVDKAKKTERVPNVFVKRSRENTLVIGASPYKYHVGIKVGPFRLTTSEWRINIEGYIPEVDGNSRRLDAEDAFAWQIAYELADRIATTDGLRAVKINGGYHNLTTA